MSDLTTLKEKGILISYRIHSKLRYPDLNRSGERQNQKTNDKLIAIVQRLCCYFKELIIYGNRTEWSPTRLYSYE